MEKKLNILIKICFILYFVILITERSLSVILSINNGVNLFGSGYHTFTYLTVFLSFVGFLAYFIIKCLNVFKFDEEKPNYTQLCIASGILLLSGMVHTEYTISGIQFAAYGILIVGILLKVILLNLVSKDKPTLWLSFAYLVAFSMAIPVTYPSLMSSHVGFHVLEGITSYLLVGVFTFLMIELFKGKENLFLVIPLIVMLVLDIALIVWRWQEEINYFVLIFASLSLLLFVPGFFVSKRKANNSSLKQ